MCIRDRDAIHRAGKLHRDVKPSNVMVDGTGRVVLLDFGLMRDLSARQTSEIVGTPLYMSPEQCAGGTLDEASDWYAFGVLLYEVLAGRPPFSGGALEVLEKKKGQDPPPPSQHAKAPVPPDLESLCRALLRRTPGERPSGTEVLRLLDGGTSAPRVTRGEAFIGRDAER